MRKPFIIDWFFRFAPEIQRKAASRYHETCSAYLRGLLPSSFRASRSPGTPRKEPRGVPTRGASAKSIPKPPPHDSGLLVVRWQTYARGFTRCKRHKTASPPALSGYSPAESLSECRRAQPPHARPTTPPAGRSTRRPPRV